MKERAYPVYTVNKHAEGLLVGGHPWVYENDILNSPENEPENGTLADVVSTKGSYLGTGFVSLKSKIRVRLISHNANDTFDAAFWRRRVEYAWSYRKTVLEPADLSACRVIFGEADQFPGLTVDLSEEDFIAQVQRIGLAVIGQTKALAPADGTLYALRDVTSTVDSLPLIASSIMSKKLASGADAIVLDVKTGSGAIMQDLEGSIALGKAMVEIGALAGKPVTALVTGMAQPLGTHVGNALEVKDAIDVLQGRTQGDLKEVSLLLGSQMLVCAGRVKTPEEGRVLLEQAIANGAGLRKFQEMIAAQGGDPRVCEDLSLLPQAAVKRTVRCGRAGYVAAMDTQALGLAAQAMGAGRMRKEDKLDYSVGFVLPVRIGDRVEEDTELCTLYARNDAEAQQAEAAIRAAITIQGSPVPPAPLCYAIITREGVQRLA